MGKPNPRAPILIEQWLFDFVVQASKAIGILFERTKNLATKVDVTNAIQALKDATAAEIGRVAEDVAELQRQIAAGGGVTAADLDEVVASLQGVVDNLKAVDPLPEFPATPTV